MILFVFELTDGITLVKLLQLQDWIRMIVQIGRMSVLKNLFLDLQRQQVHALAQA